jgi:hypothetical protein
MSPIEVRIHVMAVIFVTIIVNDVLYLEREINAAAIFQNIWSSLKTHLEKNVKPDSKETLIEGIQEFWKTLSPRMCNRYINHIFTVLPAVALRLGKPSGY